MNAKSWRRLSLFVLQIACSRTVDSFTTRSTFQVQSVAPSAVVRGTGCTLLVGSGFNQLINAQIGGVPARSAVVKDDQHASICPAANAPIGVAAVALDDGSGLTLLSQQLSVVESALALSVTSATVAQPGDSLTLFGHGFDLVGTSNNQVSFGGGVFGTVNAAYQDRLVVTVPAGAKSGPATVALAAVDPASTPVASVALTILQPFSIASVTTPNPSGAFVGETVSVTASVALAEIAAQAPAVTVAGVAARVSLDSALEVVVPAGVNKGAAQLCVTGALSTACVTVNIRGQGHTDLLRAPSCTTLNFLEQDQAVSYDYPYQSQGTSRNQTHVFVLDSKTNAVQVITTQVGATPVYAGAYPLPAGGSYRSLISHVGTASGFEGGNPDTVNLGYAAVIDDNKNAVVILPIDSTQTSFTVPVAGAIDRIFVIDAQRIGVLYQSAGSDFLAAIDMLALPTGTLAGTTLGGSVVAMAPVELNPVATPTWLQFAFAVQQASAVFIFATLPASGTTWTIGAPTTATMGFQASPRFAWIPGTYSALWQDQAITTLQSPRTLFVSFANPSLTFSSDTFLSFQTLSTSAFATPTYFPAVTARESAAAGYWLMSEGQPRGMSPSTFTAFVNAASLDTYLAGLGGALTLSLSTASNPSSQAFISSPGADSWIGLLREKLGTMIPRYAMSADSSNVSFYELPYATSPPNMTTTTKLGQFTGFALRTADAGLGGDNVLIPDNRGALFDFNMSALSWTSALAQPEWTRVDYWPAAALFGLRVGSPFRDAGGIDVSNDTAPELLLDSTGTAQNGFTYFDTGSPLVDPATGSDASVTLSVTALPVRPTLTFSPFVNQQSDIAHRRVATLEAPTEICFDVDPENSESPTEIDPSESATLTINDTRADTFTDCFESAATQATPLCAQDDPSDATYHVPNGGGPTCTTFCRQEASILVWPSSSSASIAPLGTGLCGNQPAVIGVTPSSDPTIALFLWTTQRPPPGFSPPPFSGAPTPVAVQASVMQITGQVSNLTSARLGQSPIAVGLTPHQEAILPMQVITNTCGNIFSGQCDTRFAAYDSINQRWLYAIGSPSRLMALDEKTLAVSTLITTHFITWEISPDSKRVYLLAPDQITVNVYDNQAQPAYLGVGQLPQPTTTLRASGDGNFLLSAIDGGYCRLSD